jgi:hypothetical protein
MRAVVVALVAVLGLAACGGGGKPADLPAGQHDLGDGTSVDVTKIVNVKPGVYAIEVTYFNNTGETVDLLMSHGYSLVGTDRQQPELVALDDPAMPGGRPAAIPPHSSVVEWTGWKFQGDAKPAALFFIANIGDNPVAVNL